ncbi:aldehyde dehydrogenase [Arhodomonas aquaeolei]|uniref:aldehyde dehydrogenase n=1 Tax=Arhodomonas aquaeolei TaxID=2369 RepID=UPI002166CE77|nr:aldehyde dehydrogenase [Arhodomonas aquaeolei]MCS4503791.1 aldehyde dehydrogenase [Arhodomonas aquaeolei]
MSQLATRDEYEAIARALNLPVNAFIDGRFTPALSGETFETHNPATGEVLARIAACDAADVDHAVIKARQVFERGSWSKHHPSGRKDVLIRLCKLIIRHQRELAVLESLESGKTIRDCETLDLPETVNTIKWHAEAIDKIYDQVSPSGDDALGLVVREPIGVVACVLPWNFPLMTLAWKIGPALAAGNSVVVKPAEQTTMSALRVAELAMEAGLPAGVLNVITGEGERAGRAIGMHADIDMVSFTGSTDIGRRFLEYSAASNLKRVVLECGGKNPCIVLDDADRLDVVADHAVSAVFWNMGENCSSNSRLIVHRAVKDELMERILERTRDWRTGDPLQPENSLGAIVDAEQHRCILSYVDGAREEGATVVLGGVAIEEGNGLYIEPTIIDDVTPGMTIAREEVFGPVLAVITVDSAEEAVRVANDTDYGLAASVFTANVRRAHNVAKAVRAGTVTVNCYGEGDITTPFGGFKQSGFGGRDNSIHAHDQYTELKTIWLDLGDDEAYYPLD